MDKEIEIKKKKRKLSIYYGLLVTVICIIGVSFAWFRLYLSQTENNTIASRTCFNTTLTEDTSKISLTDAFPITDEDGLKQTPFTFTIKNNCNSYVKVYITIDSTYRESTNTSYLKDNYVKVNISPKGTTTGKSVILGSQTLTDLENNKKGYIIVSTGLKANEEKSYDLRIWMDSSVTTEQGLNKNWSGKIVVVSNAAKESAPAPNGWYEAGASDSNVALHLTLPLFIFVVSSHSVPLQSMLSFASIFLPFLVHSTDALYLFVVGNVLLSTPSIKAATYKSSFGLVLTVPTTDIFT